MKRLATFIVLCLSAPTWARAQASSWPILESAGYTVLVATPSTRDSLLAFPPARCGGTSWSDDDTNAVEIFVVPRPAIVAGCSLAAPAYATLNGIIHSAQSPARLRPLAGAQLMLADAPVGQATSAPATLLVAGAPAADSTARVFRISVAPETFRPRPDGRPRAATLVLDVSARTRATEVIAIPSTLMRNTWYNALPTLASGTQTGPLVPLSIGGKGDLSMRALRTAYAAGDARTVVEDASAIMAAEYGATATEVRVRAALAVAALGDSTDARLLAAEVQRREPCLGVPAAPALFPSAFPDQCNSAPANAALRSALLPGLGSWHRGHGRSVVIGAGIALLASSTIADYLSFRSSLRDYEHADNETAAAQDFQDAASARTSARHMAMLTVSAWAANVVYAYAHEAWIRHHVNELEHYGEAAASRAH